MPEENNQTPTFVPFFDGKDVGENLGFKSLAEKALLEKYLKECKEKDVIPQTSVLFDGDK